MGDHLEVVSVCIPSMEHRQSGVRAYFVHPKKEEKVKYGNVWLLRNLLGFSIVLDAKRTDNEVAWGSGFFLLA